MVINRKEGTGLAADRRVWWGDEGGRRDRCGDSDGQGRGYPEIGEGRGGGGEEAAECVAGVASEEYHHGRFDSVGCEGECEDGDGRRRAVEFE